jgi:hypothetical protein
MTSDRPDPSPTTAPPDVFIPRHRTFHGVMSPVEMRLRNITMDGQTSGTLIAGDRVLARIFYTSPADAEVVWMLLGGSS